MNAVLTSSESDPDLAPDAGAERAALRVRMLGRLAEIGLGLAERLAAPDAPVADAALAYARVARAVRQTLALQSRLDDQQRAEAETDQATKAARRARAEAADNLAAVRRVLRRNDVLVQVEQAIEDEAPESDAERLLDGLNERLDDIYEDEDFVGRPLGEVVAAIRADLGLPVDPALLTDPLWLETGGDWEPPTAPPSWAGGGWAGGPFAKPRAQKGGATTFRARRGSG